jgi:hypothetical protein
MREYLVYYSTNTKLAYRINEKFYKGLHFVYCTPFFDKDTDSFIPSPPSSSPKIIYENFYKETQVYDVGGRNQINANKIGLKYGVKKRLESNIITKQEATNIINIIESSEIIDFEPLLYVIPHEKVKDKIVSVDLPKRGNPFFEEYIIDDLTTNEFNCIELPDLK